MNHSIRSILFVSLVTLGISACQTTGGSAANETSYFKITELSAFEMAVVGKKLWYKSNKHVVIEDDGTWIGDWDGKKIGGEWVWEDGAFCRTMATRPRDCQQFEMSDNFDGVRVTRDRGAGKSFTYWFNRM